MYVYTYVSMSQLIIGTVGSMHVSVADKNLYIVAYCRKINFHTLDMCTTRSMHKTFPKAEKIVTCYFLKIFIKE